MAVSGRKPKPTARKRVEGNPGKRKLPENEVRFRDGDIQPPEWFNEHEREEWARIVPDLQGVGVAKPVHQGALEGVCVLYGAWRICREAGDVVQMRLAYDTYRKALNEFGLTPASATRIPSGESDGDEDPTSDYFTGPRAVNDG